MVENRIQDFNTVTCSIFQIYLYDNLFNSDKHSKIQNKIKLNKKTVETLLNELLVLENQKQNETVINKYNDERGIKTTYFTCSRANKLSIYWILLTLDR